MGTEDTDPGELSENPDVLAALDKRVTEINTGLNHVEQVKKYRVLGALWTTGSGELTPKLSLRRKVIEERYKDVIDALY